MSRISLRQAWLALIGGVLIAALSVAAPASAQEPPTADRRDELQAHFDRFLDAFFRSLPSGFHHVGFDVAGTPFGQLPGESSVYAH